LGLAPDELGAAIDATLVPPAQATFTGDVVTRLRLGQGARMSRGEKVLKA
jgi:hypothetical protein